MTIAHLIEYKKNILSGRSILTYGPNPDFKITIDERTNLG